MSINIRHDTNDISTTAGIAPTVGNKVIVTPDINYGFRNQVINGSFKINQRGLTSTANDVYGLDRWYTLTSSGNVTIAQQTLQEDRTPTNIRLTQPDVTAKQLGLATILEGADSLNLRGSPVTLSMRLRSSSTQTYNYAILEWTGTLDTVTSDVISAWGTPITYIANVVEHKGSITLAANTWTDVPTLTATIGSTMNNLMIFVWSDAVMAQNVTLDIARVQLEAGNNKTPFEHRPMALELGMCQRFYWETGTGSAKRVGPLYCTSTTTAIGQIDFPTQMRVTPNVTYSGVASDYTVAAGAVTPTCSSAPTFGGDNKLIIVNLTVASGLTAGDGGQIRYGTANANIQASAEL